MSRRSFADAAEAESERAIEGLRLGYGGWVQVMLNRGTSAGIPYVLARVEEADRRLVVAELYLEGRVTDHLLRQALSMRAIENVANAPDVADLIRGRLAYPSADLRTAASYYSSTFGGNDFDENGRGIHWAAEMWASQLPLERRPTPGPITKARRRVASTPRSVIRGVPDAPLVRDRGTTRQISQADCRIVKPSERPYPVEFYEHVAAVYRALVSSGRNPARAIADASSEPITTVHRWIREARKKGGLGPAPDAGVAGW
jgi:hypothetical protein